MFQNPRSPFPRSFSIITYRIVLIHAKTLIILGDKVPSHIVFFDIQLRVYTFFAVIVSRKQPTLVGGSARAFLQLFRRIPAPVIESHDEYVHLVNTPRVQPLPERTQIRRNYAELSRPVRNCPGTILIGPRYARVPVYMVSSNVNVPYCTEIWVCDDTNSPRTCTYGCLQPGKVAVCT